MKAAIETSKHVHIKMLEGLWAGHDNNRMSLMLHGFCMISTMDMVGEPDAYAEMTFLRDMASTLHQIDLIDQEAEK